MNLNLLPREFLVKALVRRRLRQWSLVWATCAVFVACMLVLRARDLVDARDETALIEAQCEPVRAMQQANADLTARMASLAHKPQLMQGLDLTNRALLLLGEVGQEATQSDGRLQLMRFDLQTHLEAPPKLASGPERPAANSNVAEQLNISISLHGLAFDSATVAQFVSRLREREALDKVKLKSSSSRPSPVGILREFHVEGRM
ncbi:MAG: hypothetical protein AB7I37_21870 [Pirellulales bacterium]